MAQETTSMVDRTVKEAVSKGMDTRLREPILEGVDERHPLPVTEEKRVPFGIALMALAFFIGYALGRRG